MGEEVSSTNRASPSQRLQSCPQLFSAEASMHHLAFSHLGFCPLLPLWRGGGYYYHPHCADEQTEAQGRQLTCPKSRSQAKPSGFQHPAAQGVARKVFSFCTSSCGLASARVDIVLVLYHHHNGHIHY
ncbi:hypothetical protein mRhiFer1_009376 [Rhinolophus ferrumequinum]|uniref:Uncharacterized protein n=1 Tax=Rhinolophus ferrumequinum TaxID=59479 RepID=A0A7J7RPP4_RHIFE|nr:hypothetical protein mRhiFer1_009376 [Rhinolophus ferrumequinum]